MRVAMNAESDTDHQAAERFLHDHPHDRAARGAKRIRRPISRVRRATVNDTIP